MNDNDENLQENNEDASITASAEGNTEDGAAGTPAEDTQSGKPYEQIIEQQKSTIDALLKRTDELTGQINKLLSMGVQITDGKPAPEQTQQINNMPEDYVTLEQLGAEFGKK